MRARNISTRLCTTRVGSRRSGNTRANLSAKPRRRSAIARSITPPFEVRRPPSKAAVTFLARTAGNENGRIVSSVMAGVAFAVEGDGVGFATESYAASALYTTLASLSAALWRIRRARSKPVELFGKITLNIRDSHGDDPVATLHQPCLPHGALADDRIGLTGIDQFDRYPLHKGHKIRNVPA